MADVSAQTALLRGGRFRYTGRLSYVPRTLKFSRFVNMASIPNPLLALTFDGSGTGAYTDVREGMTVVVFNGNTDVVKGFLRVAYGGASSAVLQVNEVAKGTVDVRDNDRFEVIEEWDIWDVLVSASATFDKDSRRAYVDEGTTPPPVANSGGPVVGEVDPDTGELLVDFPGATSFVVAASGSLTHAWDFGSDATPPTSTSASPSGVSIPEGFRFALHTVTANGKADVERVPVWAYGPNFRPLPVRMRSRRYTALGWSATFDAPAWVAALLRERGFIVYSEDEERGGVAGSFGSNVAGRSHIKFTGYLDRTSIRVSADETTITFEAISPLAVLEKTGALPQLLARGGSGWTRVDDLNFWRALWYLLYWGSTTKLSHDFLWPDGQSYAYAALAVDNDSSIQGQLEDIGDSIKVEITCDMLGRIICVRNPNFLSIADRAARTTMYTLGKPDFISADLDLEHRLQYKFVRGEALTPSATVAGQQAIFSDAPGPAPGPGTQTGTLSKQIATQDELNARNGDHLAALNGTYYDETTKAITRVPQGVNVALADGYDVFDPAYREFVAFPLDVGRYTFDGLWLVEELSVVYGDDGSKEISATVSHSTHGSPGTTFYKPPPLPNPYPDFDDLWGGWDDYQYQLPFSGLGYGNQRMATVNVGGVGLTDTWHYEAAAGGPLWTLLYATPWSGTLIEWCPHGGTSPAAGWVLTTTELGYLRLSDGTYVVKHTFATSSSNRSIDASFAENGFVAVVSYYPGAGGTKVLHSTNNSSFTETLVNSYDGEVRTYSGIYVSSKTPGKIVVSAPTGSLTTVPYVSVNHGFAWAPLSPAFAAPNVLGTWNINAPFMGNNADSIYFYSLEVDLLVGGHRFYRYMGGSNLEIAPQYSGERYMPFVPRNGASSSIQNPNRMLMAGRRAEAGGPTFGLWWSDNIRAASGVTWQLAEIPGATGVRRVAVAGDDPNIGFAWGSDYLTHLTINSSGVLKDSRLGNLPSLALGETIGLAGW